MASSVTVEDGLRKKIKKLAAELDTTQGEIIKRAIDLFEAEAKSRQDQTIPNSRKIIEESIYNHKREKWKQSIREKLGKPGIDIEEMRMEFDEIKQT